MLRKVVWNEYDDIYVHNSPSESHLDALLAGLDNQLTHVVMLYVAGCGGMVISGGSDDTVHISYEMTDAHNLEEDPAHPKNHVDLDDVYRHIDYLRFIEGVSRSEAEEALHAHYHGRSY